MREGVAIMVKEGVDVSITGNATNMVKFQHPVSGTYKKYTNDHGQNYFACASGGGIGRTLNVDDIAAGPASYGFTDMLSRIYADATFAGSSSVPAHVEMMGTLVHQLTQGLTMDEILAAGLDPYYVNHGLGVYPSSAAGVPFTAAYLQSKGDPITDLYEDMAAEGAFA